MFYLRLATGPRVNPLSTRVNRGRSGGAASAARCLARSRTRMRQPHALEHGRAPPARFFFPPEFGERPGAPELRGGEAGTKREDRVVRPQRRHRVLFQRRDGREPEPTLGAPRVHGEPSAVALRSRRGHASAPGRGPACARRPRPPPRAGSPLRASAPASSTCPPARRPACPPPAGPAGLSAGAALAAVS